MQATIRDSGVDMGGSKEALDPLQIFLVYQDQDTLIEQSL